MRTVLAVTVSPSPVAALQRTFPEGLQKPKDCRLASI